LVFEFMEKNLLDLMKNRNNKRLNEGQIKCLMYQAIKGISYMHKYNFFHRDLKPENILVNGDNIKIADFGLAREIRSVPPYTDYVSTRWYRAPECLLKSTSYNSPIDIWAMGCIMVELYTFKPLFPGSTEKEVLFKIASQLGSPSSACNDILQLSKMIDFRFPTTNGIPISQIISDASDDAYDFIDCMLQWEPSKRATAQSLLGHAFFVKNPIPARISTPEYGNNQNVFDTSGFKKFSSYKNKNSKNSTDNITNANIINRQSSENDEFNKMLEDTQDFNNCKY